MGSQVSRRLGLTIPQGVRREKDLGLWYLYPVFWKLRFHGQHLPGIDIWVVGLIECLLQLLKLVGSKDCPEGSKTRHSGPRN